MGSAMADTNIYRAGPPNTTFLFLHLKKYNYALIITTTNTETSADLQ